MIWPRPKPQEVTLPNITLSAFRVTLRPPQAGDYQQWSKVRRRNRDYLQEFEPTWPKNCLGKEFFTRRLRRQIADWRSGRAYSFLIFKKDNDVLIGGVNINHVCRGAAQYGTLGYWLDEAEQGMGYMAESLRLIINFGFKDLRLHRFNAGCLAHNERSANLLLKLGFEEEGFAKNYVQINGAWQDHRLFGLPIESWQASAAKSQSS